MCGGLALMPAENDNPKVAWTRRLFVRESLLGWLGLVIGPAVYSLLRRHDYASSGKTSSPKDLGSVEEFPRGKAKELFYAGRKVLLARLSDGRWSAVSAVCTHLGCSVRLGADGNEDIFACTCHNSMFDIDGRNLSGPAPFPLKKFDVEVKDGRVILSAKDPADGYRLE